MQQLLSFWYGQSPNWVWHHFISAIHGLDGQLAVADTFRNLSKPLFQDYTWQGRIVGFLLRILRIGAGLFIFAVTFFVFLLFYVIWLLFPIVCVVSLVGSFIGNPAL